MPIIPQEPDPRKPSSAIIYIDPAMALRMLEKNVHNRNENPRIVKIYSRDMSAGRWALNGDAIKFATDGSLLDGQHRLLAIVDSGVTVPMFVVRGLPRETQVTMDRGMKRTAGQALVLAGVTSHPNILAATARIVRAIFAGAQYVEQFDATTSEIMQTVRELPELAEAVEFTSTLYRSIDCTHTVAAYCFFRLAAIDRAAAEKFFTSAAKGTDLSEGDPILALIRAFRTASRERRTVTRTAAISAIFRAWNHWRAGNQLQLLRILSKQERLTIPEPK